MSVTAMPAIAAALPAGGVDAAGSTPQPIACEAALFEQLMAPQLSMSLSATSAMQGDDEDQDDES